MMMDALLLAQATLALAPLHQVGTYDRFEALLRVSTTCPTKVLADMLAYACEEHRVVAFIEATTFPVDAVAPCHEIILRGYGPAVLKAALSNRTWRIDTNDGALQAAVCFCDEYVVHLLLEMGGYPWHGNVPLEDLFTYHNAVPLFLALLPSTQSHVLTTLLRAAQKEVCVEDMSPERLALSNLLYHSLHAAVCQAARANASAQVCYLLNTWAACPFKVGIEEDTALALVRELVASGTYEVLAHLVNSDILPLTPDVCVSIMEDNPVIGHMFSHKVRIRRAMMIARARTMMEADAMKQATAAAAAMVTGAATATATAVVAPPRTASRVRMYGNTVSV